MATNQPLKALDLFSGAGGAAMGYYQAGFTVLGVDIRPMPRYPFQFVQGDALEFLATVKPGDFDLIHASPPCQAFSKSSRYTGKDYPDLISATREALQATGCPWVIENVPAAPLRADYRLCGCMFGLKHLRWERWFETSWQGFCLLPPCVHTEPALSVCGHGTPSWTRQAFGRPITIQDWREAMRIDWMNRDELAQAIPPAYTRWIGEQMRDERTMKKPALLTSAEIQQMNAYLEENPPEVPPPADLPFFDVMRIAATLAALDEDLLEVSHDCSRQAVEIERLKKDRDLWKDRYCRLARK